MFGYCFEHRVKYRLPSDCPFRVTGTFFKTGALRDILSTGRLPEINDYEDLEFVRAGGDVICGDCGKKYYDHPLDREVLSYDGYPFLNIRCDGVRLKL